MYAIEVRRQGTRDIDHQRVVKRQRVGGEGKREGAFAGLDLALAGDVPSECQALRGGEGETMCGVAALR